MHISSFTSRLCSADSLSWPKIPLDPPWALSNDKFIARMPSELHYGRFDCMCVHQQFTVTYKFGGAAVADAERMVEVAKLICQFPEHAPVVVMSAMGKVGHHGHPHSASSFPALVPVLPLFPSLSLTLYLTRTHAPLTRPQTTNLLLEAAEQCLESKAFDIPSMPVLKEISELHHEAMDLLEIDQETRKEVEDLLQDLEQLLVGISMLQEITKRANDNLVSFGERMSTRIFSAYLRRYVYIPISPSSHPIHLPHVP